VGSSTRPLRPARRRSSAWASVSTRKVLCIIESMKLMNEIEAETSGIIDSKLVMTAAGGVRGALFAIRAV